MEHITRGDQMMNESWSHETELAAGPDSASRARSFVAHHLLAHQMPGLVDDVQVVASELATNAVVHAQTPITVVLWAAEDDVFLEVSSARSWTETRPAPRLMLHAVWSRAGAARPAWTR